MNTSVKNEWWGYSQKYGWVVLDRNIVENQPGNPTKLLFVRCSDWTIYEEERGNWESPKYIFEDKFISKLSIDDSKKTTDETTRLKADYQIKRRGLHIQYSLLKHGSNEKIIERHKAFLNLIGKTQGLYKGTSQIDPTRRITHCFSCKNHLDNIHNLECAKCGWIICENCGACGCGFQR